MSNIDNTSYPKAKIKVLFLENISEAAVQYFKIQGYTDVRKVTGALSEEELIKVIKDVHILGISSLAAGHKTLVPQVIAALKKQGREDILVIVGGVIPQHDHNFLFKSGVSNVFGPGSIIAESAIDILKKLMKN